MIKIVVFFTFWQDMLLTALVHEKVIVEKKSWSSYNPETSYTVEEVKAGLQNFIVCIEMFFAALGHAYAFSIYDYKERPDRVPLTFSEQLGQVFGVLDVLRDVLFHFGCVRKEFTEADIDPSVYNRVQARTDTHTPACEREERSRIETDTAWGCHFHPQATALSSERFLGAETDR